MNIFDMQFPILSMAILTPIIGSLIIFAGNFFDSKDVRIFTAKFVGIFTTFLTFLITLIALIKFDNNLGGYQFVEKIDLANSIGLSYHLGLDGLSILFVVLNSFLILLCLIYAIPKLQDNVSEFVINFLVLNSIVIACFAAVNLLLFYIFFEAMLIPMYIIIGYFGGSNRIYAAFKFFLYTFAGSMLFLFALVIIFVKVGSFDMTYLFSNTILLAKFLPFWIWPMIFIAMAVKVPMVPVHTWLPDAHVEAPTAGSVILAGILLKVGGYGMIRVNLQMMPDFSNIFAPYIVYAGVFAIIYGSLVALAQKDMKKMIAYSSVAHMGYVTSAIFSMNNSGLEGALLQMLSHGLISSGLFFVVGMLYERMHTREISAYGGVAPSMPILAAFFMVLVMGSVGLPGTSGFIAEFLCMLGIFKTDIYMAFFAAMGVVLGALYMLKLYRDIMFGNSTNTKIEKLIDLKFSETFILSIISLLVLYVGIFPEYALSIFRLGLNNII